MPKKGKILITVKTYPTPSSKYGELVCTAGIRQDGSWVRIYPLPFRRMDDYNKFPKYCWIDINLEKNKKDKRPESFSPCDRNDIKIIEEIGTGQKRDWKERKNLILKQCHIFTNLTELIQKAKNNELSLAIFKPNKVIDFVYKEVVREWDQEKIEKIKQNMSQGDLFYPNMFVEDFKMMPKLPYKFSYNFFDDNNTESTLMIEDWEVGQLFWNCMKRNDNNEQKSLELVKEKYFFNFTKNKDLYFFLGTTSKYHFRGRNPFIITYEKQFELSI
jgi:hypothetical protein